MSILHGPRTINPLTLAPALWLDASDASTLYDATVGGNLVPVDSPVARWEDKSGNGINATQVTAGNRPLRKSGSIYKSGAILFDATNDVLELPGLNGGTAYSVFAVHQKNSDPPASGEDAMFINRTGTDGNADVFPYQDGRLISGFFSTVRKTVSVARPSLAAPNTVYIESAPNSYVIRINGASYFSTTTNTVASRADSRLGHSGGAAFHGFINEIILFKRILSDYDRQLVEYYLSDKYAIPLT